MTKKILYRYAGPAGIIINSLSKPEGKEYIERIRMIADEGKKITNGLSAPSKVVDADSSDGYYEVYE